MAGVQPPAGGSAGPPSWPAYHAYGTRMAPPRMRRLGGRATAATVLLGVMAANWLLPAMQLFGASRASDPALPLGPAPGRGRGSPLVVLWAVMFSWAARSARSAGDGFPTKTTFQ